MTHPIINAAADVFEVSPAAILSDSRSAQHVRARQAAIYALTEQAGMGLRDAAATVGRSDHTTALYAIAQVRERITADAHYAAKVAALLGRHEAGLRAAARALLDGAVPFGSQALVSMGLLERLREAMDG